MLLVMGAATPVEPVRPEDRAPLEAHLAAAGLPVAGLARALASAVVVRDGDEIAASAALEPYGADALLRSVAVSEARRGTGLGEAVVRAVLELAGLRGHRRVYLLTETAADWFGRFGFRPIRRSDLPAAVAASPEAAEACADGAVAMVLELELDAPAAHEDR